MALKIIHTADWHLGQTFFGFDRQAEQDAFLCWLLDTLAECETDVLLIAGDVFDVSNPSAAAQRRFFRFIKEANDRNPGMQIVVIAGNHDSAARLEAPSPLLEELRTTIVGTVRRNEVGEVDLSSLLLPLYTRQGERQALCLAVPFLRQGDYPRSAEAGDSYVAGINRMYAELYAVASDVRQSGESLVALGHLYATGAELSADDRSERILMGGLESVSADTFDTGLAYTALGHIHKAQRIGGREEVRYSGSPLPMSFSETNYRHQVITVTLEGGEATSIQPLPIPLHAELWRVPEQPASPAEVIALLEALPSTETLDEVGRWPFVEVRVRLTEPDPSFRHRVEEALRNKPVRLTSIVPSYPNREEGEAFRPLSYSDLQKINPLDMLKHAFHVKYAGELPEEMEEMFNEVIREVEI